MKKAPTSPFGAVSGNKFDSFVKNNELPEQSWTDDAAQKDQNRHTGLYNIWDYDADFYVCPVCGIEIEPVERVVEDDNYLS